jgi:hypothetical protein
MLDFGLDCVDTARPTFIEQRMKSDEPRKHPCINGARFASVDQVLDDLMQDTRFKSLKTQRDRLHC